MENISCHSKQSSYPIGTKTKLFTPPPPPIDAICEIWKESASQLQRRSRLKMLTDGRRTNKQTTDRHVLTDGHLSG